MTTLTDVKKLAKQLGAKVEDDKTGYTHECRVEAPHGKRWKCREVHEIIDSTNRPWKPGYADMLDNMKFGLEECPDKQNCEWCYPED